LTDLSSLDASAYVRLATDGLVALWTSSDRKGLLRRLATGLVRDFGVTSLASTTFEETAGLLTFSPYTLGISEAKTLDDSTLSDILRDLRRFVSREEDLREGVFFLDVRGVSFAASAIEMAESTGICLIWDVSPSWSKESLQVLDLIVRGVQHEARWLRRLDSAQSLIYRDDLTGLFNTRYLEIAIDTELKRAQRYKLPFSLLFIDLDGFKPVNDQHGHLSGSAVLKQVALIIREVVREIDIPIRYGGDEFVILLVGATSQTGLLVAERIRHRIAEEPFKLPSQGVARLTCSIGVASFPDHGEELETLLKIADENMYLSKKSGKNRVSIVNRRLQETAR
jgi:diguanylate cyclase (GGDEF)-like protein